MTRASRPSFSEFVDAEQSPLTFPMPSTQEGTAVANATRSPYVCMRSKFMQPTRLIWISHMTNTTDMGKYHTCCHPRIPHVFVLYIKVQYTIKVYTHFEGQGTSIRWCTWLQLQSQMNSLIKKAYIKMATWCSDGI